MSIITDYLHYLPIVFYIMEANADGYRLVTSSDSLTPITGYTSADLPSLAAWQARIHPADRPNVNLDPPTQPDPQAYNLDYRWQFADGTYHWLWDRGQWLPPTAEHPARRVGYCQDITERKGHEREHDALNQRLKTALRGSRVSLYSQDNDLRYVWFYNVLIDADPDTYISKRSHEIVDPDQVQPWDAIKRRAMETHQRQNQVLTYSGRYFEVEVRPVLDDAGEVEGTTTITMDVTDLKRAELDLAQKSRQLELSNAALEQFAYVASHDLQEPLRAVTGYLDLLNQMYGERLDDQARDFIHEAVTGAERMRALIHGLLEFSRIGRSTVPREPTPLSDCVERALKNLEMALDEAQASVTVDDLPTCAVVAVQMAQLFQNLLSNAIKFRDPQRSPIIHISAESSATAHKIGVHDNGIGIDPAYHRSIFGVFQRLHTREEYPGTGIGLALCQRIVEQHGGVIWLESSLHQGTTFYFTLPK